jgi:glycosyltransferase involved in cell wall biosynthesis
VLIAFLDVSPIDYTPLTPYQRPIGGTQSAASYLSVELARRGHTVFLINSTTTPGVYSDVTCLNLAEGGPGAFLNGFDVVIVVSGTLGTYMRQTERVTTKMVLWAHMAHDQTAMQGLRDPVERGAWDGFAFVSEWQRDHACRSFGLKPEKTAILRNAVGPSFLDQPIETPWFQSGAPPRLVYTTTPFRGLTHLLAAFPRIRATVPDVTLSVFSSMKVYQYADGTDPFENLYKAAGSMDGVEYRGSVDQPRLAAELSDAAALAYPSIFAETSCIVAMEAMAIGADVLATDEGALPETLSGFGRTTKLLKNQAAFTESYARLVIDALSEMQAEPEAAAQQRDARIEFIRSTCRWDRRAEEWETYLSAIG